MKYKVIELVTTEECSVDEIILQLAEKIKNKKAEDYSGSVLQNKVQEKTFKAIQEQISLIADFNQLNSIAPVVDGLIKMAQELRAALILASNAMPGKTIIYTQLATREVKDSADVNDLGTNQLENIYTSTIELLRDILPLVKEDYNKKLADNKE